MIVMILESIVLAAAAALLWYAIRRAIQACS
jgi:hypothetical protein